MAKRGSSPDTFQPHKNSHHFFSALIIAVVAFGLGVVAVIVFFPENSPISTYSEKKAPIAIGDSESVGRENVEDELKTEDEEALEEIFFETGQNPIYKIGGFVKSVKGNEVALEFNKVALNNFELGNSTKIITIIDETTIEKREKKSEIQYKKEYKTYRQAMLDYKDLVLQNLELASEAEVIEKPDDYVVVSGSVIDIMVGDNLWVTADVNIRENDSFEAISIEVVSLIPQEPESDDLEVGIPVLPEEILEDAILDESEEEI